MIVGPDGVGKTSIAQQLVSPARASAQSLLGMDVEAAAGRVLYIAADRPRQAASSLRRMVTEADEAQLDERLVVWKGPLEFDLDRRPADSSRVRRLIGGVTDVVIDSLKDLTPDLVKDEIGSRVNMAFQELVACGIRTGRPPPPAQGTAGRHKPRRLADVYGSRWLTAGMGSCCCSGANPATSSSSSATSSSPKATSAPSTSSTTTAAERPTSTNAPTSSRPSPTPPTGSPSPTQPAPLRDHQPLEERDREGAPTPQRARRHGRATRHDDPDGLARYFDPKKAP